MAVDLCFIVSGNAKLTEKMGEAFLGTYQVLNLFLLKPANTAIARVNSRKKLKAANLLFVNHEKLDKLSLRSRSKNLKLVPWKLNFVDALTNKRTFRVGSCARSCGRKIN